MKKFWILVIVVVVVFASCSHDQVSPAISAKGDVALSLTGSTSDMVVSRSSSSAELQASTQVGVYALETSPGSSDVASTIFSNGLYIAKGSDGAFTTETPFYLLHSSTYKVLAYAPYQKTVADVKAIAFAHGTDVLYASPADVTITGSSPSWTASAVLGFLHKVSQIKFTLVSGVGSPDLTNASLKVTGFNESCTLNLNDGTFIPVKGAGASITEIGKAICFVPDAANMNLGISVTTAEGRVYSATITRTFSAGSSYAYTITLNKNDSSLGVTGTIIDWVNVDGGNIPIEG